MMDEKPATTNTSPILTPTPFFPLANDSTAHIEISFMENYKDPEEIIDEARNSFYPEKLRALKEDKTNSRRKQSRNR